MSDGPGTPKVPVELMLAQRANAAMDPNNGGKNPAAVTERLHTMLQFLRTNPEIAANAQANLDRGADPAAIEAKTWELAQSGQQSNPTSFTGQPEKAGMIQNALDMFPLATKGMAAMDATADATSAALKGASFVPTLRAAYNQNYNARESALGQFRRDHPYQALASGAVGVLGPIVATMGAAAPEEAASLGLPKASLAVRALRGARTGAALGAIQGISQAHGGVSDYATAIGENAGLGAVAGGLAPVAGSALGAGARALGLPNAISKGSAFLAEASPFGNRFFRKLAASTGTAGEASEEVGRRLAMDEGSAPNVPIAGNLPPLAMDAGGPNIQSLAEGIAKRPGQGQTILKNAVQNRQAQMRPLVANAITQGSGVSPEAARSLQPLRDLITAQSEEADRLFGAAREATAGQSVESPTLDAVMKTPVGKQAYAWAAAQKANRISPLPQASTANAENAIYKELTGMGVPAEKAAAAAGIDVPISNPSSGALPDPEVLHYMKQYLARVARLGVNDGAQGTLATQAQGAVGVWGMIRKELPDVWRQADDAFAKKAQLIDAMNQGRNIFRTQINPAGTGRQAAARSLSGVENRLAATNPEVQSAMQTGAGMAAQNRLRTASTSIKSPGRIFASSPQVAEQTAKAFPSPQQYKAFEGTVTGWDAAQAQAQRLTSGSPTFPLAAEESARESGKALGIGSQVLQGNLGNAAKAVLGEASASANSAARQRLDAEIAQILTKPNRSALEEARLNALLRLRIQGTSGRLLPRLTASAVTNPESPFENQ